MNEKMRGDWKTQLKAVKTFFRELQHKRDYDAALRQRRKDMGRAKTNKLVRVA